MNFENEDETQVLARIIIGLMNRLNETQLELSQEEVVISFDKAIAIGINKKTGATLVKVTNHEEAKEMKAKAKLEEVTDEFLDGLLSKLTSLNELLERKTKENDTARTTETNKLN